MPRQSNGSYLQPGGTSAVTNTVISSTAFNTLETDIGTEIGNSVDRLGRGAMAANLNLGGYKINGLLSGVLATDAANVAQLANLGQVTRTVAIATNIPVATQVIFTSGLNTPGDGGDAMYVKLASAPGSPTAANFVSLDGASWQLASATIYPQMIGVTGATDDSATLIAANTAAAALGIELVINILHKITNLVTFTVPVRFAQVGRIKVSAAHQLAFSAGFSAPVFQQIFDFSALYTSTGSYAGGPGASASGFTLAPIPGVAFTPYMFGAVGNNSTPDDVGVESCFVAMLATGNLVKFWTGTFLCNYVKNYDITLRATTGFTCVGDGMSLAILNFANVTSGRPLMFSMNWSSGAPVGWFRIKLAGFSVEGALNSPLVTIGRDDFNDQGNVLHLQDFGVFNSYAGVNNEALRLNGVYGFTLTHTNLNCYATVVSNVITAYGYALRLREASFGSIQGGSIGNAAYGIALTDGESQAVVVTGTDIENIDYAVSSQSTTSGLVSLVGCWISQWAVAAFSAPEFFGVDSICAIRCRFAYGSGGNQSNVIIDQSNAGGIVVEDLSNITSPNLPASGTAWVNKLGKTVFIELNGGTAGNTLVINGARTFAAGTVGGPATCLANPGDSVVPNYTGATWTVSPVN